MALARKTTGVSHSAVHNLKLARIADWCVAACSCFESPENQKTRRCAMAVALEVNFALWIIIGCATVKALQFIEYLN